MKVARLHGPGDVRVHEERPPTPAAGRSTIRVGAVGLCGSDLHWFGAGSIGDARIERPLVLGHEFAGVVQDGELAGRLVAVDPAVPCRRCPTCLAGTPHLCPTVGFAGHGGQDGGLRELVSWPTTLLHPLPESLDAEAGALLEPLGVAIHAHDLGHVRVGGSVAVVGCGPIGLLLVQLAARSGAAPIVAVDPLSHRREAALGLGAHAALTPEQAQDPAALGEAVPGHGVDVAFEVAGTDAAVQEAFLAARPGARVVLVGIPDDDRTAFRASLARRKGLTILMSRRMADVYPRATHFVEAGVVDLASLVSSRFALEDADEAFQTAASRSGHKVVVLP